MELLVERHEVHGPVSNVPGDVAGVQPRRHVDVRSPADSARRQPRNDLAQRQVEVAPNDVVIAADAMAEFTGEMAVGFRPPSEVPDIAGRDGAKVQRIFTGSKPRVMMQSSGPMLRQSFIASSLPPKEM